MRWEAAQKLAVKLPIMGHAESLAIVSFFVHRNEHGELFMRITSDNRSMLQHLLSAWGFARSLRETPLQRFHSMIGS